MSLRECCYYYTCSKRRTLSDPFSFFPTVQNSRVLAAFHEEEIASNNADRAVINSSCSRLEGTTWSTSWDNNLSINHQLVISIVSSSKHVPCHGSNRFLDESAEKEIAPNVILRIKIAFVTLPRKLLLVNCARVEFLR